ncbi:MAG: hypothetical protein IJ840_03045 [Bacteroidales bacterium]|nr:hypothetical protein [Bacteroidales bacterium]
MNTSKLLLTAVATLACVAAYAQKSFSPSLRSELVCDFADWTPENVEVKGSTQGFAMHGKYAFVMHDKGFCCIFDMKKKAYVNSFFMPGNTGHCNNACFGVEKASKNSKFPLLYISECGGTSCCYVTDINLEGSRVVQRIYFDGSGYAGTIDWCLDAKNGFIYTYGGINGGYKLLKKFKLPKLSDSDASGEVHLTDADVLDETRLDKGINIWQGSFVRGRYAYLPDGYPPYDHFLHIVDLQEKEIIVSKNITELVNEPEGIDIHGKWVYVVLHTPRQPRHSVLHRFSLK